MKISEIKIQNRISYKNQTYTVEGVYLDENAESYVKIRNTKESLRVPAEMIAPLPIDESWLLKFGFSRTYNSPHLVRYEKPEECLKFDIDRCKTQRMSGLKFYGNKVSCKYVHQFQNFFRFLFGKELL